MRAPLPQGMGHRIHAGKGGAAKDLSSVAEHASVIRGREPLPVRVKALRQRAQRERRMRAVNHVQAVADAGKGL